MWAQERVMVIPSHLRQVSPPLPGPRPSPPLQQLLPRGQVGAGMTSLLFGQGCAEMGDREHVISEDWLNYHLLCSQLVCFGNG